jgi:glutamine synthetase adenylyltransferase
MKNAAICYRINQEIKSLYAKKQQLNEHLHKTHLKCASFWPTTWQLIQMTDSKIQQQMEIQYKSLNNKLDHLQQIKSKHPNFSQQKEEHRFYRRVKNLTNIRFNDEETQILKYVCP